MTWEYERQQDADMKAMLGHRTVKTPGLNRMRKSYLETYWAIAAEVKNRNGTAPHTV